jgi:hypothetical protein
VGGVTKIEDLEYSVAEEILDVQVSRPHVVLLGAGASRATLPDGDPSGRRLPLMNDFVSVCGLGDILARAGIDSDRNFEDLYSDLIDGSNSELLDAIGERVEEYFSELRLPNHPTVYDLLVLSLRDKDVIATFNWDPLLFRACWRNHRLAAPPHVVYLHGNVAIGYCLKDRKKGLVGTACSICGAAYVPSKLLYPVKRKGYNEDPFISREWKTLASALKNAFILTIFGYAAPQSDIEALELMAGAWGNVDSREFEQTELIDIKPEDELRANWARFIHTHHYDLRRSFHESWIGLHPRRSCEAAWQQFFGARFISTHPLPEASTLEELHAWFGPLLAAEGDGGRV